MEAKLESRSSRVVNAMGWYPSDPKFREWFNSELVSAVQKVGQDRNTSHVARLVNRIENDEIRKAVLRKLLQLFPLDYNRSTGSLKLRKIDVPFDWSNTPRINVFESKIYVHNDTIRLGSVEFSVSEFIDEIIDALILARNLIPANDLERLSETVSTIATRNRKRAERG